MKAYKATYNMKCLEMAYEVGKTYTHDGELKMGKQGFHFCKNAIDTLDCYPYGKDFELMEIDVIGDILDQGNKSVTNKLTVIRVIPKCEYPELIGITLDENKNVIKEVFHSETYFYEYDENNNKIKTVERDGQIWLCYYDENNNKIKQVYPDGATYLYYYDENNNKIKSVCPNGETYFYS